MRIYVAHPGNLNYKADLYIPIRKSELNKRHEIILPHENDSKPYDSKNYLKTCDLLIAEVSYPSTGEGIELGWGDLYKVPIICIFRKGSSPSSSLKVVSKDILEYSDAVELINIIEAKISEMQENAS